MSVTSGHGRDAVRASRPAVAVPQRAQNVELIGELRGSGYRRPPALVRRGDGQVIQLTPLLYQVLAAIDGHADHEQIARRVSTAISRGVTAANIRQLIADKLEPLGVLRSADGTQPRSAKSNPLLGLRLRRVISKPEVTNRITTPFARLFHPLVVTAVVLAFAVISFWVLFDKGLAGAAHQAFQQPGLLLLVFAVTAVSAGFHEFGHAAAARYGGAVPGAMGFGLYLMWPAFYTDVTDSYRLGRGGRLRTDLGGLYFNAVVAVAMYGIWWLSGWDALLLVIATQILQMVRQLTPLVRFDGYHVLADLVGVPDLFQRIKPTLLGLLPHRWGSPESTVLKPWARAVVTIWVVVVVPLLLTSMALVVLALPRIAGTAWHSIGNQWRFAALELDRGEVAAVLVRALSIVAIVLPLLGIALLLARLVKSVVTRVWRATAGKPVRRAVAAVAAVAVAAALLWAWWPEPERYRPIDPGERGTVLDALPQAGNQPVTAAAQLAAAPAKKANVVWPSARTLPTKQRPALAMVLVPKAATSAAPTLVLPFDLPRPPGADDNQALVVNTADGSVQYDVSFALVWVTDGTVDSRNEAYALASCQNCTTVAVAFQVVLVVGQADVVVPRNVAVALNHSCVQCVTVALASQLVVTLPEDLDAEAKAELAAIWARLPQLARDIQHMTIQQIQATLEGVKADILGVLRKHTTPGTSSSAPPSSSPSASPSSSPPTTSPNPTTTTPVEPPRTTESARRSQTTTTPPPSTSSSGTPPASSERVPTSTK
ncbi:M50 family metallopeptidase [Kibdelosporangium phytohabitans]|uniref:Peptide zinc metalloprotease protein n=1 Tax=Kibdelosporangium phytohabitans TaxID=860235 RepID=A0A0N9IAJ1_9PSEU|nr:M50 family metallopeptidase [Kibdelosporangium phytohabitans]ALG12110.1 hypothetical protein AOZ06_39275 [Kibdelosporangium phytohabitans]MBE1463608.1 putative peptide zinc metalloprotease protein [Kibdelosporangium phytohabitans]